MEGFLARRESGDQVEIRVKWSDYELSKATWVPKITLIEDGYKPDIEAFEQLLAKLVPSTTNTQQPKSMFCCFFFF